MIWVCMAHSEVGRLHIVDGTVNMVKPMSFRSCSVWCHQHSCMHAVQASLLFSGYHNACHRAKPEVNNIRTLTFRDLSIDLIPINSLWRHYVVKRHQTIKREFIESRVTTSKR